MSANTARRESITYPNGRVVTLGYGAADSIDDLFSLVQSVAVQGESGDKVAYTRAGLGRYVSITYPQPALAMSMLRPGGGSEGDAGDPYDGYDRFGRVQEMRWEKTVENSVIDSWQWGYNQASNRTWKKNLVASTGQDEAYRYDGLYQVLGDALGTLNTNRTAIGGIPGEAETFRYDPTGNWLGYRKDEDGAVALDQTRANNQDNQLTQLDGSSALLAYDRAGNATKTAPGADGDWSKCFQPVWDAWNRLVEVKDENGATVQKNAYDGLTRRITQESDGEVIHTYWSDRWKPLEERIDSGTTAARQYVWGERPGHRDELVLRDRDTDGNGTLDERLYATMDYFNGTAVLDASGAVQERYGYSAFGVRRVMAADFTPKTGSDYDWEFGFQGQFRDKATGWLNYGYRFYLPELGRWINRDPIEESGGQNLYSAIENNPLNSTDHLGLRVVPRPTPMRPTTGGRPTPRQPRPPSFPPPGGDPRGNPRYKGLPVQPQIGPPGKPPGPWKFQPPGDCSSWRHRQLQDIVDDKCKKDTACKGDMCCPELDRRRMLNLECAMAREKINFECFRGGDGVHRDEATKAYRAIANCDKWRSKKGC